MTMAESKPKRLRPWLEGHLNRGDIPGLRWLNEDRTLFRITWKHHGKQDWSPEHGRVFMVSVRKQLIDIFVSFLRIFVPPAMNIFCQMAGPVCFVSLQSLTRRPVGRK